MEYLLKQFEEKDAKEILKDLIDADIEMSAQEGLTMSKTDIIKSLMFELVEILEEELKGK